MSTPTKVLGFVLGLLALFAAATGIGTLFAPTVAADSRPAEHTDAQDTHSDGSHTDGSHTDGSHSDGAPSEAAAQAAQPGGLLVSSDGYTLDLAQRRLPAAKSALVSFRILGPDGRPVTRYTRAHDKDLHLIVVRRDLTRFQHVHPQLAGNGTWRSTLDLGLPGAYRVFADFTPTGHEALTLGSDLFVPGDFAPAALPAAATTAEVAGYTVTLDGGLLAGRQSTLRLTVSRDGKPVTDLQPYLGAYGHLVALRDRDLAYLHVHPDGHPGDGRTPPGPEVAFSATAPSGGAYRLFLDFRHGDRVHTAEFTVTAEEQR